MFGLTTSDDGLNILLTEIESLSNSIKEKSPTSFVNCSQLLTLNKGVNYLCSIRPNLGPHTELAKSLKPVEQQYIIARDSLYRLPKKLISYVAVEDVESLTEFLEYYKETLKVNLKIIEETQFDATFKKTSDFTKNWSQYVKDVNSLEERANAVSESPVS